MKVKHYIPNFITSLNLFCGCLGITFAFTGELTYSVYAIWLAMLFDFFDGFAARMLKVSSPIGKELDSLADMVTFGVLPSIIMYQFITLHNQNLAFTAFTIAIFSALRLAKFNVDESQSDQFIGLPTPANAIFISSLVFVLPEFSFINRIEYLLILTAVCSIWLVMPVALLALKFKNFGLKGNEFRLALIVGAIVLLIGLKHLAIPLVIVYYLVLSIVKNLVSSDNIN